MTPKDSAKRPRLRIPLLCGTAAVSDSCELGSAHVSLEIDSSEKNVTIEAECTKPPWCLQPMVYLGVQSNGKHLYTMLFVDVPLGPVKFRTRIDERIYHQPDWYGTATDDCKQICSIVESKLFPETKETRQYDSGSPPESLKGALFSHESAPPAFDLNASGISKGSSTSWQCHRRTRGISLPTPPISPLDVRNSWIDLPADGVDLERLSKPPTSSGGFDHSESGSSRAPGSPLSLKELDLRRPTLSAIKEADEEARESSQNGNELNEEDAAVGSDQKRKWCQRDSVV